MLPPGLHHDRVWATHLDCILQTESVRCPCKKGKRIQVMIYKRRAKVTAGWNLIVTSFLLIDEPLIKNILSKLKAIFKGKKASVYYKQK